MKYKQSIDYPPQHIIDTLSPFVTPRRQQRIADVVSTRLGGIHVALENPYDPHNAAAVIRNCEAMGVYNLHVIGGQAEGFRSQGVTQGSHHWIHLNFYQNLDEFRAKTQGFLIAGACMDGETTLQAVPVEKPVCILLGNEHDGLSPEAIALCDITYRIPMYGMSESFNLSVSAGISLYDLSQRKRQLCGATDLEIVEASTLTANYYLNSVESRLIEQLF